MRCLSHEDHRAPLRDARLHTPQQAVLQIVAEATPKETSTDKIERVLNALVKDQKTRQRIDRPQERLAVTLARPLVC